MDLRDCIEALVCDDEYFVEIADLYYEIVDMEGQEFYDSLVPEAIVPTHGLGSWAILRDGADYRYEFIENPEDEVGAVITKTELLPLLELYPYDHFTTRMDLADYIYSVASVQ